MSPTDPIVIELPAPVSTNRTRRIDWAGYAAHKMWKKLADGLVLSQWRSIKSVCPFGRFEITITLSEAHTNIDLDNIKVVPDYLKRIGVITDDSKKYMRRVVIEWGEAKSGCKVTLRGVS